MKITPRRVGLGLVALSAIVLLVIGISGAARAQTQGDPYARIDSPASNSIYNEGDTVSVTISTGSSLGVAEVDLLVDGVSYGKPDMPPGSTPPLEYKTILRWTAVAGTHTLSAQVIDSENRTATDAIRVIVTGKTPTPTPTLIPILTTPTPGPASCTLSSRFVADVTIPDNTVVAPGAVFVKTWAIQNNGTCAWGPGYTAVFIGGEQMAGASPSPIASAQPGQTINVTINFVAPYTPGAHKSNWQLRAANGVNFGIPFYVLVQVPGPPTPVPPPTAVPPPPPPPNTGCQGAPQITSFYSNKGTINRGEAAQLQWGPVYNSDYVSLQTPNGTGGVATPGNQQVRPGGTTTFTLAAFCKGFQVTAQTTIYVNGPPPPTPVPPQGNRINSVTAQRQPQNVRVTVGYFWNGQAAPAYIQGWLQRNGSNANSPEQANIIAGFDKFVILNIRGGQKVTSVNVCMIGRGGQELACRNAPVP